MPTFYVAVLVIKPPFRHEKIIMKYTVLFVLTLFFTTVATAQNKGNALLLNFNYGNHFPQGDLQSRFGSNLAVALSMEFMLEKSNLFIGANHSFLFGNTVKEDPIANLRDSNGLIFNNNFTTSNIDLRQRGFASIAYVGKLFGLAERNRRSGIRVQVGAGLLQHKIRIQDDPNAFVTQLSGDTKKAYDRLTNGFALQQFIGYQHLAKNRLANFYIGAEFIQGFTQNRRDVNIGAVNEKENRTDILVGFKLGWTLPFYIGKAADVIYY